MHDKCPSRRRCDHRCGRAQRERVETDTDRNDGCHGCWKHGGPGSSTSPQTAWPSDTGSQTGLGTLGVSISVVSSLPAPQRGASSRSPGKLTQRFCVFSVKAAPFQLSAVSNQDFLFLLIIDCGLAFPKYNRNELVEKENLETTYKIRSPFLSMKLNRPATTLKTPPTFAHTAGHCGSGGGPGGGAAQAIPPATRSSRPRLRTGPLSAPPCGAPDHGTRVDAGGILLSTAFPDRVLWWNQAAHL